MIYKLFAVKSVHCNVLQYGKTEELCESSRSVVSTRGESEKVDVCLTKDTTEQMLTQVDMGINKRYGAES